MLFFRSQNHLFSFTVSFHGSFLAVSSHVFLFALDGFQFFGFDLSCFLHRLGGPSMAFDAFDLGHVRVPSDQSLVILELLPLSSRFDSSAVRSICPPQSDVAIVRPRKDIIVVRSKGGREDPLHSFGVIDVSRMASISVPQPDGAIIRGADQLFPCRTKLDVHDCRHMVFQHVEGPIHLPHVKNVYVVVFVGYRKVEGFHRIPRQGIGGKS